MADDHRSISKSRGPAPTCLVRRLAVLIVLVGAVAVPLQLISSSPASASPPDSCKNPHCYDQAVIGVALSGLEGQWTDEDFKFPHPKWMLLTPRMVTGCTTSAKKCGSSQMNLQISGSKRG